jgi:hypothetical protein
MVCFLLIGRKAIHQAHAWWIAVKTVFAYFLWL